MEDEFGTPSEDDKKEFDSPEMSSQSISKLNSELESTVKEKKSLQRSFEECLDDEDLTSGLDNPESVFDAQTNQNEQLAEMLTSELFYEMLAEAISNPVPERMPGVGPID